jgi:hypothetical protein
MIKSSAVGLAGFVTCMKANNSSRRFLIKKTKESEELNLDMRLTLK